VKLELLHLCDSLFPVGAFGYSEGLETATVWTKPDTKDAAVALLGSWMDAVLDESFGRLEGPTVARAWSAFDISDWMAVRCADEEVTALRPSSGARKATRAMGLRLLTTWQALHPAVRLEHALAMARRGEIGPALPVAFAGACACSAVARPAALEAFAYTRLAATVSAAMRLMPIGQTDAHALLARELDRVPALAARIDAHSATPESFAPAMDIAAMSQQYLHSRLFRS
jgi:urease accessory protein